MFAKKVNLFTPQGRTYRRELKYLYARRTAVDALIQTLQDYNRYRAPTAAQPAKRKLA